MLFAVPSSAVNSFMDYFSKLLAVSFRERLTRHFHSRYLDKMFYYKVLLQRFIDDVDVQLG
jgi:ATP-binding cassette subfamily D (ALD) protein 3